MATKTRPGPFHYWPKNRVRGAWVYFPGISPQAWLEAEDAGNGEKESLTELLAPLHV